MELNINNIFILISAIVSIGFAFYCFKQIKPKWNECTTFYAPNVLEMLASGMTHAEILEDYEDLEELDLQACLAFAAKLSKVKDISRLVA